MTEETANEAEQAACEEEQEQAVLATCEEQEW